MITILGYDDYNGSDKKALLNKTARDISSGISSQPGDESYLQDLERAASDVIFSHNLNAGTFSKIEHRSCINADGKETLLLTTGQIAIDDLYDNLTSQGVITK